MKIKLTKTGLVARGARVLARAGRPTCDERGSISIASAGLVLVAITVFLPMVWNLGAVRVVRRLSQNSSDAAALAAAETVARQLNEQGRCVPVKTPSVDLRRYVLTTVAPLGNDGSGAGAADQYARSNRGTLRAYGQRLYPTASDGVHSKLVDGVVFPPSRVYLETQVPIHGLLVVAMYGGEGTPVRSAASAEVYLAKVRVNNIDREGDAESAYLFRNEPPCPVGAGKVYTFRWLVRLVPSDPERGGL